jgi:hypothetical protein
MEGVGTAGPHLCVGAWRLDALASICQHLATMRMRAKTKSLSTVQGKAAMERKKFWCLYFPAVEDEIPETRSTYNIRMRTKRTQTTVMVSAFCALVLTAKAATFGDSFDGGVLNPNLVAGGGAGFAVTLSGGRAVVTKDAGVGNGRVAVDTIFQVAGDFTATVRCGRAGLGANTEVGLMLNTPTNGYADVFFFGDNRIHGNLDFPPWRSTALVDTSASTATFRVTRAGDSLILEYDIGSGFQTLYSATNGLFGVPMSVSLFLINEFGETGSHSGWFDNLAVTGDQFLYEGLPIGASIWPAVEVCWSTDTNHSYQVQWRSALDSNTWFDFGPLISGDGSIKSVFDSTRGSGRKFYRVLESP